VDNGDNGLKIRTSETRHPRSTYCTYSVCY